MTVAVAGALALQDVVEGAAVVVLFAVADWMETQCTSSARDAISAVLALKPEQAVLAESGRSPQPAIDVCSMTDVNQYPYLVLSQTEIAQICRDRSTC